MVVMVSSKKSSSHHISKLKLFLMNSKNSKVIQSTSSSKYTYETIISVSILICYICVDRYFPKELLLKIWLSSGGDIRH